MGHNRMRDFSMWRKVRVRLGVGLDWDKRLILGYGSVLGLVLELLSHMVKSVILNCRLSLPHSQIRSTKENV